MSLISRNNLWEVKYFQRILTKKAEICERNIKKMKFYAKYDNKRAESCVRISVPAQYLV